MRVGRRLVALREVGQADADEIIEQIVRHTVNLLGQEAPGFLLATSHFAQRPAQQVEREAHARGGIRQALIRGATGRLLLGGVTRFPRFTHRHDSVG